MLDDLSLRFQTLHEIIAAAHQSLNRNMWDYVVGGTETETTLLRNRAALDSIALRPRVLNDVSNVSCKTDMFGRAARLPLFLAPIGGLDSIAQDGCIALAEAAAAFNVPFFLSSITQTSMEDVAKAGGEAVKVFQLYTRGDAVWIDEHVRRAKDSGYDAFCLTVDSAHYSRRERDIANRFGKPWRGKALGMEFQAAFGWKDVERFRAAHDMPFILKGLMTAEDAVAACERGVDAIVISNHGGRQLDHGQGAMDVLAEIVDAVGGRCKVYVDGGFNRGSDIVKALALGADGVGIGRLFCYGLAAAGAAGIVRVLELLELEMIECLGLLGVTSPAGLERGHVASARPVTQPGTFSAFPLLDLGRTGF